jgi:hypothetical protein
MKPLTLALSASLMIHSHHYCDEIDAHSNLRGKSILTQHSDLLSFLRNYGVEPQKEHIKSQG